MSFHPRTPQSPSQLSPNGTEPFSGMASFVPSTSSTLPTPAHSINDTMAADGPAADESPQKRKRPLDDDGDRDQKKVHIEDRRLGIDALHENVGDKYLLCRTRKTPFRPSPQTPLSPRPLLPPARCGCRCRLAPPCPFWPALEYAGAAAAATTTITASHASSSGRG